MTTGMSSRTEVCQILGQDSRSSLNVSSRLTPREKCGQIKIQAASTSENVCPKYGPRLEKHLRREKSKNGSWRNTKSTTLEG